MIHRSSIHHMLEPHMLEDPGDEQAVAELLLGYRITPRPTGSLYVDPQTGQLMSLATGMPVID